jgi:hypothetical protein
MNHQIYRARRIEFLFGAIIDKWARCPRPMRVGAWLSTAPRCWRMAIRLQPEDRFGQDARGKRRRMPAGIYGVRDGLNIPYMTGATEGVLCLAGAAN